MPTRTNSPLAIHFIRPSLHSPLFMPQILAGHAKENPAYPLFRYLDPDLDVVKTIPWADAIRAFHRVAQLVMHEVPVTSSTKHPTVAILAVTDQITYFCLVAGIMSVGYRPFPISPRNSESAVTHLLQSTDCNHVFVSNDDATRKLVEAAAGGGTLKSIHIPVFGTLFEPLTEDVQVPRTGEPRGEDVAMILHSSAFPKVVRITHTSLRQWANVPHYGEIDLCGLVWGAHGLPNFHLSGLMSLFWTAMYGMIIAVMPPTTPPVVPTPSRVFDDAVATNSDVLFCVPSFLEGWARDPTRRPLLKRFRSIIFAGGPLQPSVGDELTKCGVNIAQAYGLTETAGLNLFLPKKAPEDGWSYFEFSPHSDPVFVPVQNLPGVYRLILKKCATHLPAVLDITANGVPAFDTNDLLVQHPTNPKLWKVYGRQDDQIMHSTGEKTNPTPLEAIMLEDPRIRHAIMFGRGILVFPTDTTAMDSDLAITEFRRQIWPAICKANEHAPTHSRIFPEMILVGRPSKPVPLTAKGTPIRGATIRLYQEDIDRLYSDVERSAQTHLHGPDTLDLSSITQFVERVVGEVMHTLPGEEEDLFQHGCDSLQANWIRNSLLRALNLNRSGVPDDFVYRHPTIRRLAEYLTGVASGSSTSSSEDSSRASEMHALVQKYTSDLPRHVGSLPTPAAEGILVTGTTGALGCHILAHLLSLDDISIIYALNRPSKNLEERQREAFASYGLDWRMLRSDKLRLIEGSLTESNTFGLPLDVFDEMHRRVTCIIHNAWQVDFKLSLSSMEPCIAGTRNLVDLALTSPHSTPPRLLFVSSFGMFRNWPAVSVAPEESIPDANVAAGSGYAESKWVAEQVLETAANSRAGFSPVIVRVGQLSGAANGAWKSSEWFPTLLKLSQNLGRLPDVSGQISWVPVYQAGKLIVDMRQSQHRHLHLTHPHPISFSTMAGWMSDVLKLPIVPYADWLATLEADARNGDHPLLHFFRSCRDVSGEAEAFLGVSVSNEKATSVMSGIRALDVEEAQRWVGYLKWIVYLSRPQRVV